MPYTLTPDFTSPALNELFGTYEFLHLGFEDDEQENDFRPTQELIDYLANGEEPDEEDGGWITTNTRTAFVDEIVKRFFQHPAFEERIKTVLEINAIPPVEEIDFSALYQD